MHSPCNCTSVDVCGKRGAACNETTGLPWQSCDGHENLKQIDQGGLPLLNGLSAAVDALAQAYYWSRNETYAARAAELIDVFFLQPATRMNPSFEFAQSFPGVNDGCGSGLVEIDLKLVVVIDSINLLSRAAPCRALSDAPCPPSPSWTPTRQSAMLRWLQGWHTWMKQTPYSTWAVNFYNNHNAAARNMWFSVAVAVGDLPFAAKLIDGAREGAYGNGTTYQRLGGANCRGCNADCSGTCALPPIGGQIWRNGELPKEEARVNSVGYTVSELENLFMLGQLSRYPPFADYLERTHGAAARHSYDLLSYVSKNGSSIRAALDYLIPFALNRSVVWPHPTETHSFALYAPLRQAAAVWHNGSYARWAEQLPAGGCIGGSCATDASRLWWPSPPTSTTTGTAG